MKMGIILTLAVVCLPASSVAQSATQDHFDLVCSGTLFLGGRGGGLAKDWSGTFRLDLSQGKWCQDECKLVRDLVDVRPSRITFIDQKSDNSSYLQVVDRETGGLTVESVDDNLMRARRRTLSITAKCEPRAFSGFPEVKTKF